MVAENNARNKKLVPPKATNQPTIHQFYSGIQNVDIPADANPEELAASQLSGVTSPTVRANIIAAAAATRGPEMKEDILSTRVRGSERDFQHYDGTRTVFHFDFAI